MVVSSRAVMGVSVIGEWVRWVWFAGFDSNCRRAATARGTTFCYRAGPLRRTANDRGSQRQEAVRRKAGHGRARGAAAWPGEFRKRLGAAGARPLRPLHAHPL